MVPAGKEKVIKVRVNNKIGPIQENIQTILATNDKSIFREYRVELYSKQGKNWVKTGEGILNREDYKVFYNMEEVNPK